MATHRASKLLVPESVKKLSSLLNLTYGMSIKTYSVEHYEHNYSDLANFNAVFSDFMHSIYSYLLA